MSVAQDQERVQGAHKPSDSDSQKKLRGVSASGFKLDIIKYGSHCNLMTCRLL